MTMIKGRSCVFDPSVSSLASLHATAIHHHSSLMTVCPQYTYSPVPNVHATPHFLSRLMHIIWLWYHEYQDVWMDVSTLTLMQ